MLLLSMLLLAKIAWRPWHIGTCRSDPPSRTDGAEGQKAGPETVRAILSAERGQSGVVKG